MFGFLCRCQKRLLLLHSWVLIYDINHKLWDSFSSNTDDLYWFNAGIKVPNTPGSCCVLFKAQNNTFLSYKSEQEKTDASQRENCEEPPPARGPSVTTVPQHFWASSWTQWHRVQVVLLLSIKGTVQSNMSLLSLFTPAHGVHNLCAILLRNKNMFWRMLGIKPFWCLLTKKRDISKYLICSTEVIQFWVDCSFKSPYNSIMLHLQWLSLSHRKCSLWPSLQKHLRELHKMTIFHQTLLDFIQNNDKTTTA